MKKSFLLLALVGAALANAARADITLANFGTGQFTKTFSSFALKDIQTATNYEIAGSDQNTFIGSLPATVTVPDLSLNYTLTFTATFTGDANTSFQIDLLDSVGNERLYQGSFADFTPGVKQAMPLTLLSGSSDPFNNSVVSLGLLTTGLGSSVDLTMQSLVYVSPVPEPSAYLLCGGGAVLLAVAIRRKKLAV